MSEAIEYDYAIFKAKSFKKAAKIVKNKANKGYKLIKFKYQFDVKKQKQFILIVMEHQYKQQIVHLPFTEFIDNDPSFCLLH